MKSKNLLLFVVNVHLVLSATTDNSEDDRQNIPHLFNKLAKKHRPYSFEYGVNDEQTGTQFERNENSDGKIVTGSYSIQLPDGRKQIVNYKADHKKGYQAEVTYQGEAKYPDQNNIKLSNPILLQPLLRQRGSNSNQHTLQLSKQENIFNNNENSRKHRGIPQNYQIPPISNPALHPPYKSYESINHEDQNLHDAAPNYPGVQQEQPLSVNSYPILPHQDPSLNLPELLQEDSIYSKFEPSDFQLETDYNQPEQNFPRLGRQQQVPVHQQSEARYHESKPAHQPPSSDHIEAEPNIPIETDPHHLEPQENYREPISPPSSNRQPSHSHFLINSENAKPNHRDAHPTHDAPLRNFPQTHLNTLQ